MSDPVEDGVRLLRAARLSGLTWDEMRVVVRGIIAPAVQAATDRVRDEWDALLRAAVQAERELLHRAEVAWHDELARREQAWQAEVAAAVQAERERIRTGVRALHDGYAVAPVTVNHAEVLAVIDGGSDA